MAAFPDYLAVSSEVQQALAQGQPLLALESTVITHGLAWPRNLETAQDIEASVRAEGVVPATVAVLDGKLHAGLEASEIEQLARLGPKVRKCSRRDLPLALQSGAAGATTVAATMMVAAMAGIRIFATGGIGGVHRGAESSFDISADLQELARTPVAVVCAGPKAILDLGLTCEYLETQGVPVIGYQCDQLPAFYSRDSGFAVDQRLDSAAEIAAALRIQWELGMAGALVVNPIPEAHALDRATVESAIAAAIKEADAAGIRGKELTPWLLARLDQLSGGDSVAANVALLLNNARLGARIAVAFQRHAGAGRDPKPRGN
jgi:pseudouridine-5'-phosphate glycosidase